MTGWRQFDSVESNFRQAGYAYSHDAGRTWTFPGVLAPGVFRSDPVLDAGPDGTIYYFGYGLRSYEILYMSRDGGVTWDDSVEVRSGDKPWMTVDRTQGIGRGNIYTRAHDNSFSRSTDGGATFMDPTDAWAPFATMSVAPDGAVYLFGKASAVVRSSNAKDPAQVPEFEHLTFIDLGGRMIMAGRPNPSGLVGQTWIATDHSDGPSRGNVYVLGSMYNLEREVDVRFSRSTDAGLTWSENVRVNDDAEGNGAWQWFAMISVAPNGRIDAVWNDTRNHLDAPDANLSELYYAYSTDAGVSWSKNIPVSPVFDSHVGWPNDRKIGDYYHMISDNLGVNIAYAATFNGEQDVYFLRVGPWDCNGNEIPDDCDIDCSAPGCTATACQPSRPGEPDQPCIGGAAYTGITDYLVSPTCGTSLDCNANEVPDECEYRGDHDGNGLTDLRDLAALQQCFTGDFDTASGGLDITSGDSSNAARDRRGRVGILQTGPLPYGRGTDASASRRTYSTADGGTDSPSGVAAKGLPGCCALFDLQPDGDVDLEDHTAILRVLSGP